MTHTKHTPTPICQGMGNGANADQIYDAEGNGLCQVYGVPMHTKMADVAERFSLGMQRAAFIVRCVNSHDDLLEALQAMVILGENGTPPLQTLALARAAIAKAKA